MRRDRLPNKIFPNPLLTSLVEVRFKSNVPHDQVLSQLWPHFQKDFPNISDRRIPIELKQENPNLEYHANYVLSNSDYILYLDHNIIGFENKDGYSFWSNYFPVIKKNLEILNSLGVIENLVRVGLRYASFFNSNQIVGDGLRINHFFEFDEYSRFKENYRCQFHKENILILLQIAHNAKLSQNDEELEGVYIDIDAAMNEELPNLIDQQVFDIIDFLHKEEKTLFFSLLSDSFLDSLNPTYK